MGERKRPRPDNFYGHVVAGMDERQLGAFCEALTYGGNCCLGKVLPGPGPSNEKMGLLDRIMAVCFMPDHPNTPDPKIYDWYLRKRGQR